MKKLTGLLWLLVAMNSMADPLETIPRAGALDNGFKIWMTAKLIGAGPTVGDSVTAGHLDISAGDRGRAGELSIWVDWDATDSYDSEQGEAATEVQFALTMKADSRLNMPGLHPIGLFENPVKGPGFSPQNAILFVERSIPPCMADSVVLLIKYINPFAWDVDQRVDRLGDFDGEPKEIVRMRFATNGVDGQVYLFEDQDFNPCGGALFRTTYATDHKTILFVDPKANLTTNIYEFTRSIPVSNWTLFFQNTKPGEFYLVPIYFPPVGSMIGSAASYWDPLSESQDPGVKGWKEISVGPYIYFDYADVTIPE